MAPHLLILPGSFCPPDLYAELVQHLRARSLSASVLALPTVAPLHDVAARRQPPASMYDDAAAVAAEVTRLTTATTATSDDDGANITTARKHGVLVVAHSYSGIPASQSLETLLRQQKKQKKEKKKKEESKEGDAQSLPLAGLVGIVYLASVLPVIGGTGSLNRADGRKGPTGEPDNAGTTSIIMGSDGYMTQDGEAGVDAIFSDVARETGVAIINERFGAHSARSFDDGLTHAGWLDVARAGGRLAWIKATRDACVPPAFQDVMIANARTALVDAGLDGDALEVKELESGHCPNVSCPEKLADLLADIAKK